MRSRLTLALALLVSPAALHAQLPRSSARSLGLLQSYTAAARGWEAIAWNPALLALPGNPRFSLNIVQAAAQGRSNTFSAGDFLRYWGDSLTTADKNTILAKVRAGDPTRPLSLGTTVDATALALTVGRFGISLSGVGADADLSIAGDAVELALFGNVTRRLPGQVYSGVGTSGTGWAGATVALAYAFPLPFTPVGHLAMGVTLKLTRTMLAARATELGSFLQNAPSFDARIGAEALAFHPDSGLSNGFGVGLDVGGAYELASGLRLGLTIENVFATMSWNKDRLMYYRSEYLLQQNGGQYTDSTIADIDTRYDPTDPVQAALYDSTFNHQPFPTRIRAGAQLRAGPVLVTGDLMLRVTQGAVLSQPQRLSGAAELPLGGVFALRGGLATDFDGGITYGGGMGFKGGPVHFDLATNITPSGTRKGVTLGLGLSIN